MPSEEEVDQQMSLLITYRRNLHLYLQQQASLGGSAYVTPGIANGIVEVRQNIHRIKAILCSWQIDVPYHPDDEVEPKNLLEITPGHQSFVLVDSTPLLGDEGDIWPIQYDKCNSVDDLLDDIFIAMDGKIPSLTYSVFWVLRDKKTRRIFLDIGTKWANENLQHPWDYRGLAEVGILPNTSLEVIAVKQQ